MKKRSKFFYVIVIFFVLLIPKTDLQSASSPLKMCSKEEWEVLKLVNKQRRYAGMEELSVMADLQKASETRASEISKLFSHMRPNKKYWYTVLNKKNGYYDICGENIASGQTSAEQVVKEWIGSYGHKKNILNRSFSHLGVGHYTGTNGYRQYWSQFFMGSCKPTSIFVLNGTKVKSYDAGTTVEQMDRVLVIKCKHGTGYVPISGYMCSGFTNNRTGTYKIKVKYKNKTAYFTVKIKANWIHSAKADPIYCRYYNGYFHKPKPILRINGKKLAESKDYILSYRNNRNRGTGQIVITGRGNYRGSISLPFKII